MDYREEIGLVFYLVLWIELLVRNIFGVIFGIKKYKEISVVF